MSHQIQGKNSHLGGKCNVKCPKIKLQAGIFWCAARVTCVQVTLERNCQSKNPMLTEKKKTKPLDFSPGIRNSLFYVVETERFFEVLFILSVVLMPFVGIFPLVIFSAWREMETWLSCSACICAVDFIVMLQLSDLLFGLQTIKGNI